MGRLVVIATFLIACAGPPLAHRALQSSNAPALPDDPDCATLAAMSARRVATIEDPTWLRRAGATLLACDAGQEALAFFETALALEDTCAARVWIAVAHLSSDNMPAAEARLRDALETHPACTDASINLAAILRASNRPDEAVRIVGDALSFVGASRRAEAFDALAMAHLDAGELAQAELASRQALALEPRRAASHNTAGRIALAEGDVPRALQSFERAYTLDPDLVEAWMNHGQVALAHRDFEVAERLFENAVTRRPGSYDAHVERGIALRALGRIDEARAHYETALLLAPGRPEAMFDLALLLADHPRDRADRVQARSLLQRFVATTSDATLEMAEARARARLRLAEL